jgi:hypothetical protein
VRRGDGELDSGGDGGGSSGVGRSLHMSSGMHHWLMVVDALTAGRRGGFAVNFVGDVIDSGGFSFFRYSDTGIHQNLDEKQVSYCTVSSKKFISGNVTW